MLAGKVEKTVCLYSLLCLAKGVLASVDLGLHFTGDSLLQGVLFPQSPRITSQQSRTVIPRQTGEADHLVEGEVPSASESGILETADASLW